MTWEGVPAGYGLTWSDEFNGAIGSQINTSNWTYETGPNGANAGTGEFEYDTADPANSHVVADPNATDGKAMAIIMIDTKPGSTNYTDNTRYTSAKFQSVGLQQYGPPTGTYYTARIHLAPGWGGGTHDGLGGAWWMLGANFPSVGWPACGEVDILENGFSNTDGPNMHSTLHYPNGAGQYGTFMGLLGGQVLQSDYHNFSALIINNQIQFFLDGNLFETVTPANINPGTWEFNQPDFMILGMGTGGGDPPPDATTSFPATMLVDYARVYQQGLPTPVPISSYTWNVACGDNTYVDGSGVTWAADTNFTGGWPSYTGNTITNQTNQQQLYQYGREGNATGGTTITYTFNVPPDSYQVNLGFSENSATAIGQRVFNVNINGSTVLPNFDIYKDAGAANKADMKSLTGILPDASGRIVIQLVQVSGTYYPAINSIQILPTAPGSPTVTPTSTLTPTPTPTPVTQSTWRIDAGAPFGTSGVPVTDSAGNIWIPDTNFTAGIPYSNTGVFISNEATNGQLTLYQTDRQCDPYTTSFSYAFNVPPGSYQVTLKFAEINASVTGAGQRVFNVGINGVTALTNFDIYVAAGNKKNWGVDEVFNGITPNGSGQITLQFTNVSGAFPAQVAAIQIISTSPTNTPTATPTSTSAAATNTPTATPLSTATSSPSSTPTVTPSSTPTLTPSSTMTSTASLTASRTATSTPSNTPTLTPTATATNTLANTATPTASTTATPTSSPTLTDTASPSPTVTKTPTNTASSTPTGTMTSTSAASSTPTATPSMTVTASPTQTVTATPSSTASLTPSSTASRTPTATPSVTATSTPTNTITLTPTSTASSTATSTGTLPPTSTPTNTGSPTATGTPTLTATMTPTATASATLTSTPTSSNTSTATVSPSQTPTGTPTNTLAVTATPTLTSTSTASNTPTGTPTASASMTPTQTPSPTPTNTLANTATSTGTATATPSATSTGTNTPSATSTKTPTASLTFTPSATVSPTFTLSYTATFTSTYSATATNTLTPTPTVVTVQVSQGSGAPANSNQPPGATNVPVQQIVLANNSASAVTLTGLTLSDSGTGGTSSITGVTLLKNGTAVTSGNFVGSSANLVFSDVIPPSSSVTYTVTANFGAGAGGTYQFSISSAIGSNGQAVNFNGMPVAGALVAVFPPTVTPTNTSVNTPTATAGPGNAVGNPYPNPSQGQPVTLVINVPATSTVEWTVFTTAFRKIAGGSSQVTGLGNIIWDLKDGKGSNAAEGLYYLRVRVEGIQSATRILKILVLK